MYLLKHIAKNAGNITTTTRNLGKNATAMAKATSIHDFAFTCLDPQVSLGKDQLKDKVALIVNMDSN